MLTYILKADSSERHEAFHKKYAHKRFKGVSTYAHKWARERWEEGEEVDLAERLPDLRGEGKKPPDSADDAGSSLGDN